MGENIKNFTDDFDSDDSSSDSDDSDDDSNDDSDSEADEWRKFVQRKRQIKKKFNYAIYYSVCMMQLDSTDSNESLCHIKIQSSREAFSLF